MNLINTYQSHINKTLKKILPHTQTELHTAMRYAVLTGGKRIRALLIYAIGEAFNANKKDLDNAACAIELIHAYSLVHDDLPAMDNDDLRHGKPTCHKSFSEATAILVGDALQSLAFEILSRSSKTLAAQKQLMIINLLAQAIGDNGMVGGQILDIASENKTITLKQLETIHRLKTGALITASVQIGVLVGNCKNKKTLQQLIAFAKTLGLVFQIQDDVLDIESPTEILGKQQGADLTKQKSTYPALLGLTEAKEKMEILYKKLQNSIKKIGINSVLLWELIEFLKHRNY